MSIDIGKLTEYGIDIETGIGYTGSRDKYISALQRYFRSYDSNCTAIRDSLAGGDIEGYTIAVHSLKSNSRMIGATELSLRFEELELAGKAGDTAFLNTKTEEILDQYSLLISRLKPIGEAAPVRAAGEIDAEQARSTADELLLALDDFDDERSAALVLKLSGYPFRLTQRNMLKEAISYIDDFMYDEAAEMIRTIYPSIE